VSRGWSLPFAVLSMTDFLRSLLTPDGMDEGRAAAVGRLERFTHAGLLRDVDLINAGGLHLRNPRPP
jgi:hypothetical protein